MTPALFGATESARWRSHKDWTLLYFALPWVGTLLGLHAAGRVPALALWAVSSALLLAGAAVPTERAKILLFYAAALGAYAAALAGTAASYADWEARIARGQRGFLEGAVLSVEPYSPGRLALRVRPGAQGAERSPWDVRLVVPTFEGRALIELEERGAPWPVRFYPFQPAGNPGEFDRRTWAMGRGYLATAYFESGENPREAASEPGEECRAARALHDRLAASGIAKALQATAWRWRCRLIDAGAGRTGVALGLLLGQTDLVSSGAREALSRAGVAHLLAVSGLHVGFVAAAAAAAGRRKRAGWGLWGWLGAAAGAAYCGVAGGPPSARRAAAMLAFAAVGRAWGRRVEGRRLLLVASGTLFAFDPFLSLDLGFRLSVAATAAILWTAPIAARWRARAPEGRGRWSLFARRSLQAGALCVAAQLSTAPLVSGAFSTASWIAPLTNAVAVPLGAAALILLLAGSVLADVLEPLGQPAIEAGVRLADGLLLFAEAVSPWGGFELPMGSPLLHAGWYAALTGLAVLWEGRLVPQRPARLTLGKRLLVAGMAAAALYSSWPTLKGVFGVTEVWVLDVGQGDSILIRSPWGRYVLVDGGGVPGAAATGGYDVGAMRVLPTLKRLGVKRLDAVINTHPHEDHVHGLAAVIAGRRVGRVFASRAQSQSEAYRAWIETVAAKGLAVEHLSRGALIRLEPGVHLQVLFGGDPRELRPGGGAPGVNDLSVALRVEGRGRSFLLAGDAEGELLEALRAWWALDSDGLLVPHHGGASSFSPEFLDEVDPEVAVISVGANAFGHPAPALLEYLDRRGIRTFRTDRHGAVLVQLWPWGISVRTGR